MKILNILCLVFIFNTTAWASGNTSGGGAGGASLGGASEASYKKVEELRKKLRERVLLKKEEPVKEGKEWWRQTPTEQAKRAQSENGE